MTAPTELEPVPEQPLVDESVVPESLASDQIAEETGHAETETSAEANPDSVEVPVTEEITEENSHASSDEVSAPPGNDPTVETVGETSQPENHSVEDESAADSDPEATMTTASTVAAPIEQSGIAEQPPNQPPKTSTPIAADEPEIAPEDELNDVEMSLFDHLEELRQRIFYAVIAVVIGIIGCFTVVRPIVQLLEAPAKGVKFLQLSPGEFFFVTVKVAAYSGLLVASPFVLYQIIQFVLPGLTRKEKRILGPIVLGSSVLFVLGLVFAYVALIPAALNFFISYGADVVEQLWSIDKYFEFVLLLLFSVGLAFQIPVIQFLLGFLGIVSSKQMLSGWRYVVLGAAVLGAVLTPSTDPLTQSLLAGAVLGLYLGGAGMVKLIGR